MSQIESPPARYEQVRSRMPHFVGVAAGIVLLAGVILLWTGQPAEQSPPAQSALASTLSLEPPSPQVENPKQVDTSVNQQPVQPSKTSSEADAIPAADLPGEFTTAILGTWKQYSHGHRLLQVKSDGTATIDVRLDGLSAVAFGEKLRIDIAWEIKDQTLIFKTTGGTPEASLNAIKSIYGDNRVYQILEINEKQMLLREGEEDKTPWDRVEEE